MFFVAYASVEDQLVTVPYAKQRELKNAQRLTHAPITAGLTQIASKDDDKIHEKAS